MMMYWWFFDICRQFSSLLRTSSHWTRSINGSWGRSPTSARILQLGRFVRINYSLIVIFRYFHWHRIMVYSTFTRFSAMSSTKRKSQDETQLPTIHTGAAISGAWGGHVPPIFRQGMLHVPQKLISRCMPLSSLTSFHSIQLQK